MLGYSGSEQLNELATALARAQASIRAAFKDSENPHFNQRYADLASVWNACRGPLTENDLAVIQLPETISNNGNSEVVVTTMLIHKSGQWIASKIALPLAKRDAQSVGSAITYGRRYGLAAIAGVAPDDDDDAERGVGRGGGNGGGQSGGASSDAITADQIRDMAKTKAIAVTDICAHFSVEVLEDLTPAQRVIAIRKLKAAPAPASAPGTGTAAAGSHGGTAPSASAPLKEDAGVINDGQAKRLFAVARAAGHKDAAVRAWITGVLRVASEKAIPVAKFQQALERVAQNAPLAKDYEQQDGLFREPGSDG